MSWYETPITWGGYCIVTACFVIFNLMVALAKAASK